jgi:hypothetical protein
MSGQLPCWNEGAACNFELSPENTNICWLEPLLPEVEELELPSEAAGFNSDHGTGTSLPLVVEDEPLMDVLDPEVELAALGSRLTTAKSTVPEAGLRTISEIVPIMLPLDP